LQIKFWHFTDQIPSVFWLSTIFLAVSDFLNTDQNQNTDCWSFLIFYKSDSDNSLSVCACLSCLWFFWKACGNQFQIVFDILSIQRLSKNWPEFKTHIAWSFLAFCISDLDNNFLDCDCLSFLRFSEKLTKISSILLDFHIIQIISVRIAGILQLSKLLTIFLKFTTIYTQKMNQNLICLEESKFGRKIPYTFLNSCDSEQCDCCQREAYNFGAEFMCHNLFVYKYINLLP